MNRFTPRAWRRFVGVAVVLCALMLLAPRPALAQTTPEPADANRRQLVLVVRFAGDATGDGASGLNAAYPYGGAYRTQYESFLRDLNGEVSSKTTLQTLYSYIKTVSLGQCRLASVTPQYDASTGRVAYLTLPGSRGSYRASESIAADAVKAFSAAYPAFDASVLDGNGDGLADTVTATTRFDPQDESGSTIITLTAALGRGETVERQWTEENYLSIAVLMAESVISPDRDALVLGLEVSGSNYGAAETHILELIDGELTERYRTENASTISGTYLTGREDSPLCDVRIPLLVDKWHAPEYHTLSWNGTGWDETPDGYFTDAETVTVTGGRVLTLALRGRYTGEEFGPRLIYDQIQVFDGDMMFNPNMLLQTILPEDVPGDDRFPDQIFVADNPSHVWIQDINFDGAEDFAVLCDSTRNQGCRWFRWNEGQGQFEYAFSLAGEVELVPEGQRLIEACWTEEWEDKLYNIYSFNNRGWMILESSPESPLPSCRKI